MAYNQSAQAFRNMRRFLQGKGVNYRRNAPIAGAGAGVNITVPGLGPLDDLVSVLMYTVSAGNITDVTELMTLVDQVAVQASFTTALAGANNDTVWNADSEYPGSKGNAIQFEYIHTMSPNLPLLITVVDKKVNVRLATSGASAIITTANDIIAAVEAHPEARRLVHLERDAGNDGTGVVIVLATQTLAGGTDADPPNTKMVVIPGSQAFLTTALAGANNDLTYNAQSAYPGTKGHAITIEYVHTMSPNLPLQVSVVSGTKIKVRLATNGASAIITTANDIIAAIEAHYDARQLVHVERAEGDGSGVVIVLAETPLAGGVNDAAAINTQTITTGHKLQVDWLTRAEA